MEVKLHRRAKRHLDAIDKHTRARIIAALRGLESEPPTGDIKPLLPKKNRRCLRIGEYRIIFHYEKDIIMVDDIDIRGQIYK